MTDYQPGACNIGATQQRARRLSGTGSFGLAGAIALAVALGQLPTPALWATAPFVFGGWLGLLQAQFNFCVAFGALARYDLSGSGGASGSVAEREAVQADRRRALEIGTLAAVLTVGTTAIVLLLLGGAL